MSIAIKVDNLYYEFKNQVVLNNISIDFEENKIYGLLGKNGAGKTTFLNIISNQLLSKKGIVEILGKNIIDNSNILENLCIVKEREFANNEVKVKYIFDIYSYFYKNYDKALEQKFCKKFKIDCKKQYKKLSRGTKSLISNIIGICSNAPITIFDEPTIGLDAVNRDEFYSLLLESYANNPRTIIISTHLIDEVENLVENVVVINDGKIIINDSRDNVLQKSLYISGRK
ncbi:MAG: ATP-binding cassette domain-containing protein [Romboutsia sp.]|uniref:ATP-binding cassette domain-containing protein n=1 Tax=Romboutsia sp. TaxID=1965302 RepID=UPI003F2AEE33